MAIDNWLTDFAWNPSKNVQSIEMITLLHWRTLQLSACSHSKSWSGHVQALSLFTFTDTNSHVFMSVSTTLRLKCILSLRCTGYPDSSMGNTPSRKPQIQALKHAAFIICIPVFLLWRFNLARVTYVHIKQL